MTDTVDASRRRLLVFLAGAPLLATAAAACSTDATPKSAPGTRADLDADVKVRWRALQAERELLALHAATVAAHPDLAELLAPLTARHEEHRAAFEDDGPMPFAAGAAASAAAEAPNPPDVPGNPSAALAAVADAETAAGQARIRDCLAASGSRFATVLASVAACESGHGAALAEG